MLPAFFEAQFAHKANSFKTFQIFDNGLGHNLTVTGNKLFELRHHIPLNQFLFNTLLRYVITNFYYVYDMWLA
jgi:hypothetical protein